MKLKIEFVYKIFKMVISTFAEFFLSNICLYFLIFLSFMNFNYIILVDLINITKVIEYLFIKDFIFFSYIKDKTMQIPIPLIDLESVKKHKIPYSFIIENTGHFTEDVYAWSICEELFNGYARQRIPNVNWSATTLYSKNGLPLGLVFHCEQWGKITDFYDRDHAIEYHKKLMKEYYDNKTFHAQLTYDRQKALRMARGEMTARDISELPAHLKRQPPTK